MNTAAHRDTTPPQFDASCFQEAIAFLRSAIPGLYAVYLYGSQARARTRPESDADLAVLASEPLAPRWELQEELAQMLHADVDLIDLTTASTVMRMQIVTTGRILYESDPYVRQSFEMRTLSAYALLNEERRTILEDVHRRGYVYGR